MHHFTFWIWTISRMTLGLRLERHDRLAEVARHETSNPVMLSVMTKTTCLYGIYE